MEATNILGPLVGAKKRKSYRKCASDTKSTATASDSGFKESASSKTTKSYAALSLFFLPGSSKPVRKIKQNSSRKSTRIKMTEKQKEKYCNVNPNKLKQTLQRRMLMKHSEALKDAFERLTPKVILKKLTATDIFFLTDDWSFLEDKQLTGFIPFCMKALTKRSTLDGKEEFLVRYRPTGIIEERWLSHHELPEATHMRVDTQSMSWQQKLVIRDQLSQL